MSSDRLSSHPAQRIDRRRCGNEHERAPEIDSGEAAGPLRVRHDARRSALRRDDARSRESLVGTNANPSVTADLLTGADVINAWSVNGKDQGSVNYNNLFGSTLLE